MDFSKALKIFSLDSLENLTHKDLKSRFKKLAKETHPDQGGDHYEFIELKNAYDLLLSKIKNIEPITDLTTLAKEDILNKYYEDTGNLLARIDELEKKEENNTKILESIQVEANTILDSYQQKREMLKIEFETLVDRLEKKYKGNFFQKILFFLPRMSESKFWDVYDNYKNNFSEQDSKLNIQTYKELVGIYGKGLNKLTNKDS